MPATANSKSCWEVMRSVHEVFVNFLLALILNFHRKVSKILYENSRIL